MTKTRIMTLALPALFVASVVGCAPTAGTPAGPDAPGGSTASSATLDGHSDSDCLTGSTWNLDVPNQAAQVLTQLQTTGIAATSSTGSGNQTMIFSAANNATSDTDLTFVVNSTLDDGTPITITQRHLGPAGGGWGWVGDTNVVEFKDWTSEYTVSNTVAIGGQESTDDVPLSSDGGFGLKMTVVCDGGTLTTKSEGSPYTMRWVASK